MKILAKILGLGFFLGGLFYFANLFSNGGATENLIELSLRLINAIVWMATGYGLLRLKKWSLYGFGGMILLYVVTNFYNLLYTSAPLEKLSLVVPATHIVLFLLFFTNKDKLFSK